MKPIKLGIMGPGNIAKVIAKALADTLEIQFYAVASSDIKRAEQFKQTFGFDKAYGSYEELLIDDEVDLVYIATPHAFHYEHMLMCIEHKKHIICEKAFCLTHNQAQIVLEKAKQAKVFVCEAMCPAFLPSRQVIKQLLDSDIIGEVTSCRAVFGANLLHVKRVVEKALGGGALLDIGIYPLYFCLSMFGNHPRIDKVDMTLLGDVDEAETVILQFDQVRCQIEVSMRYNWGMYAQIEGTKGSMYIENIARPEFILIKDSKGNIIQHIKNLRSTTGYEYEFLGCKKAMDAGDIETKEMSHQDTLNLMAYMDQIRNLGGYII